VDLAQKFVDAFSSYRSNVSEAPGKKLKSNMLCVVNFVRALFRKSGVVKGRFLNDEIKGVLIGFEDCLWYILLSS
jgi:hypothetical protein